MQLEDRLLRHMVAEGRLRYIIALGEAVQQATVRERYTKDLEDMLGRMVAWHLQFSETGWGLLPPIDSLINEAKALLESTGYTEDF